MMGVTHGNSTDGIAEMHYEIISQILRQNRDKTVTAYYQGIVVSAFNATQLGPLLDEATGQGLAVVAFENDPYPLSQLCHAATVTNNTFLGAQLAKVLNQITPQGGTFATIFMPAGPAHVEQQLSFRNERVNQSDGVWTELPPAAVTSVAMALERAEEFAQLKLKAIGTLVNVPFSVPAYEAFVDRHRDKGLIMAGLGDAKRHMDLLARRHVHGLVGHMFYDWGSLSVEQLLNVVEGEPVEKDGKFTNAIAHIQVPIDLPELVIDENRVGKLAILGYVFFGITAFAGLLCGCWVWCCCKTRVVRASQPVFLLMAATGIVIMSSGMILLGLTIVMEILSSVTSQFACQCRGLCVLALRLPLVPCSAKQAESIEFSNLARP